MNWPKNWKVPIWFKRKNKNFWDFRVFWVYILGISEIYPRSKTQKSREFCLPRIMKLIVIQDLKTPKQSTETKTKRFQYDLEQKAKFPRFPSFRFCPIPKTENLEFSEICLWLQILTVVVTQDFKKNELRQNVKGCAMVWEEKN